MISDTLDGAVNDILEYQEWQGYYDNHRPDLAVLTTLMEHARFRLDAPPGVEVGRLVSPGHLRRLADWLDNPELPFPAER